MYPGCRLSGNITNPHAAERSYTTLKGNPCTCCAWPVLGRPRVRLAAATTAYNSLACLVLMMPKMLHFSIMYSDACTTEQHVTKNTDHHDAHMCIIEANNKGAPVCIPPSPLLCNACATKGLSWLIYLDQSSSTCLFNMGLAIVQCL